MQGPSPSRLYATVVGGALVVTGIVGFFYSASFGGPGDVGEVFGVFAVNAWSNVLHIVTGAIGLLVAGFAARRYALWLGLAYVVIAVWGFLLGDGGAILGFIPVSRADNWLTLLIGALGLASAAASGRGPAAARLGPNPVGN